MGYRNTVVLVVKNGIEIPDFEKFKDADEHSIRKEHQHWAWDETKWEDADEIPTWLGTIDEENWLLLRDGESDGDYEVTGAYTDCDYRICISIPEEKEKTDELS